MTAIDPVCQMEVDEDTAEWKSTYQGQTYYFCAPGCKRSFDKEPAKYVAAAGSVDQPHGHAPDQGAHH